MAGRVPGVQFTKGGHLRLRGPWTARRVLRLKESLPLRSKPKKSVVPPWFGNLRDLKLEAKRLWRECVQLAKSDPVVKASEKETLHQLFLRGRSNETSKAALEAHKKLISKTARKIKASKMAELPSKRGKSKVRPVL
jgi:phage-related baseplate assembly protein